MRITIRKAEEADAERIHELHDDSVRKICHAVYSPEIIEGWLKNRTPERYLARMQASEMYVAEMEGKIIGFGRAVPGEIVAIYVDPAYVRRGVGTMLMKHGMKMANVKVPGVIKIDSTLNARPFYEAMGFKVLRKFMLKRNDVEVPCYEMQKAGDAV